MPHDHDHDHDHAHDPHSHSAPLSFALALTAGFMFVEIAGGLWTGSLALLADAGHMASDVGALAVALIAARIAARPPDRHQTMGYQRAEVLGAALNAGALAVLALWIAVEAIQRVSDPQPILGGPMMAVAAVGLLVNLVVAFKLHGDHHDINSRAAYLHVLGDLLGSVGALSAGAMVWAFGWTLADPLISVGIAGILVVGSVRVLKAASRVLMQAAPEGMDADALEARIAAVPGVSALHNLHIWSLRPGDDVVTVHVVLCAGEPAESVCAAVRAQIADLLPKAHVTIQPELEASPCGSTIYQPASSSSPSAH